FYENKACMDNGMVNINVEQPDTVSNIEVHWKVHTYENQPGYKAGFKGWRGWGMIEMATYMDWNG
ncbi:unnamed protein product, partial [Sphenostylis stenocarpa]